MKFSVVIGNPPYQCFENKAYKPLYSEFIDYAQEVGSIFSLILPAKFLFNAGKTSKAWNKKILNDPHLKVLYFEKDSTKIFSEKVQINGGVCILYGNKEQVGKPIEIYIPYQPLRSIVQKVKQQDFQSLSTQYYSFTSYRLTDQLYKDFPEVYFRLSKGHKYDVSTHVFDKLGSIFKDQPPDDGHTYMGIYGRQHNVRLLKWINVRYIKVPDNFTNYKILVPKASGRGTFGEALGLSLVGKPYIGATASFSTLGSFKTEFEAQAALKYIKTKFVRALVGILKVTQDNAQKIWTYVPLQDFTEQSDINWDLSIAEIDQQLYNKYDLTQDEITFIENNVKPME